MLYGKLTSDGFPNVCGGRQPDSIFDSPSFRLFFYGVLYNRDVVAPTSTEDDATIVAKLFLKESEQAFSRLDGSFTILYFTGRQSGIVRDFHGTHFPVYYSDDASFSTSLSALHALTPSETDRCSLSAALQRGLLLPGRSPFRGIRRLEAGFHLVKRPEGLSCSKVFPLSVVEESILESGQSLEECSHRYTVLHQKAIQRRITHQGRVGILLSGGYDSGSNLAALRKCFSGTVDSYSVGFKGDCWTELPLARVMSQAFDTRHYEYEIDGSEIEALPEIIRFLEEPFVEGGLMVNFCAMRMMGADKPEVILGGDGSDQYFGTSGRELAFHYLLGKAGLVPLLNVLQHGLDGSRIDTGGKLSRVRFHLDKILHIMEGERFGYSSSAVSSLLQHPSDDLLSCETVRPDMQSFDHLFRQHAQLSDIEIVINRIILFKASRMARMFGNNLTYPFMDLELYHYVQQLPVSMRYKADGLMDMIRGRGISKYLLKHCYKPLLPEVITSKKKQGGFAPMPLFFKDPVRCSRLKDFILSSSIFDDYLNRKGVEKFLNDYAKVSSDSHKWFWYRQNCALQYFNLLALATWWEEFVEGKELLTY